MRTMVLASFAALLTSLAEVDEPMPSGVSYLALMSKGITYDEYQAIVGAMVQNGLVTKSGDLLSITDKGRELATKLEGALHNKNIPVKATIETQFSA